MQAPDESKLIPFEGEAGANSLHFCRGWYFSLHLVQNLKWQDLPQHSAYSYISMSFEFSLLLESSELCERGDSQPLEIDAPLELFSSSGNVTRSCSDEHWESILGLSRNVLERLWMRPVEILRIELMFLFFFLRGEVRIGILQIFAVTVWQLGHLILFPVCAI